jgi:hypothetical protein
MDCGIIQPDNDGLPSAARLSQSVSDRPRPVRLRTRPSHGCDDEVDDVFSSSAIQMGVHAVSEAAVDSLSVSSGATVVDSDATLEDV